jgi:hypothetical protein
MNTAPPALIHNIKITLFVKRVFLQNRTFKVQQLKRKKCGILALFTQQRAGVEDRKGN